MSNADDNSEVELNHCVVGKVFVFPVPKLENAELGYKASAWQKQPIWSGRLRVVTKGKTLTILLEHTEKDGLFAACPVTTDKTVETVTDSSRYFVLRLTDGQGRHALLGLGFQDRNEAFDFKVSVQDARKQKSEDWSIKNNGPSKDYSIPQGSKIHVNLSEGKKKKKDKASAPKKADPSSITAAVAGLKIGDGEGEKKRTKKKGERKENKEGEEDFGAFPTTTAAAAAAAGPAKTLDVLGFGFDFGAPAAAPAPAPVPSKPAAAVASPWPVEAAAWPSPSSSSASSSAPAKSTAKTTETPNDWVTF